MNACNLLKNLPVFPQKPVRYLRAGTGKSLIIKTWRGIFIVIFLAVLAGCATYGEGIRQVLDQVEKREYQKARESLKKSLKPEGKDELLFYLERGAVEHLDGNYESSNQALEKAHALADKLRSRKATDYLAAVMVNPRQTTYMGNDFERVYINYYKVLNYIMLSQQTRDPIDREEHLQSAYVEMRRLDNALSSISFEKGDYEQTEKRREETFSKVYTLFDKLHGNWIGEEWLIFREDAYVRYITGCLYEKAGNLDDARIAYQKAAELYEKGYADQYRLSGGMAEQAWFDAIRMMRRLGGWEGSWSLLAKEKLSKDIRGRLARFKPDKAQIIVVQHLGMIPRRRELNLILRARPAMRALSLELMPTGTPLEMRDQAAWFLLLYGDMGLIDMLHAFSRDGLSGVADRVTHKTFFLGPAWDTAEDLNIIKALKNMGMRVTVPYYPPLRTEIDGSYLTINNQKRQELMPAESLSQIAIQHQLHNAGHDLRVAVSRTLIKNTLLYEAGDEAGGDVVCLVGNILSFLTSAAETRNWLCLPYQIRLTRVLVDPGEHTLRLSTMSESGRLISREEHAVSLESGEIYLWVQQTMDNTQGKELEYMEY